MWVDSEVGVRGGGSDAGAALGKYALGGWGGLCDRHTV